MDNDLSFGSFLKSLIKDAGLTQMEFYRKWGIKKPYFYDIVSGRINPPPAELQFKAMEILNATPETRVTFYDLAAKDRGDIPADIAQWVTENPSAIGNIRKFLMR